MSMDKPRRGGGPDTPPAALQGRLTEADENKIIALVLAACEEAMREHGILPDARTLILSTAETRVDQAREIP